MVSPSELRGRPVITAAAAVVVAVVLITASVVMTGRLGTRHAPISNHTPRSVNATTEEPQSSVPLDCSACAGLGFSEYEAKTLVGDPSAANATTVVLCADRQWMIYPIHIESLRRQNVAVVFYKFGYVMRTRTPAHTREEFYPPGVAAAYNKVYGALASRYPRFEPPHWCCAVSLCLEACQGRPDRKLVFLDADTFANISGIVSQLDRDEGALYVNSLYRDHEWNLGRGNPLKIGGWKVQTNIVALSATARALENLGWWMSLPSHWMHPDQSPIHRVEEDDECGVPGKINCLENRHGNDFHCFGRQHASRKFCMNHECGPPFFKMMFNETDLSQSSPD